MGGLSAVLSHQCQNQSYALNIHVYIYTFSFKSTVYNVINLCAESVFGNHLEETHKTIKVVPYQKDDLDNFT